MKVVQLVSRRQRRGAEVFAADLSMALIARGQTCVSPGLNPPPFEPLAPDGVVVTMYPIAPPSVLSPRVIADLARTCAASDPTWSRPTGAMR